MRATAKKMTQEWDPPLEDLIHAVVTCLRIARKPVWACDVVKALSR